MLFHKKIKLSFNSVFHKLLEVTSHIQNINFFNISFLAHTLPFLPTFMVVMILRNYIIAAGNMKKELYVPFKRTQVSTGAFKDIKSGVQVLHSALGMCLSGVRNAEVLLF